LFFFLVKTTWILLWWTMCHYFSMFVMALTCRHWGCFINVKFFIFLLFSLFNFIGWCLLQCCNAQLNYIICCGNIDKMYDQGIWEDFVYAFLLLPLVFCSFITNFSKHITIILRCEFVSNLQDYYWEMLTWFLLFPSSFLFRSRDNEKVTSW